MTAILEISDGTTTIDLINPAKGIHLNRWIPRVAQPKRGGTVQSSSLSEGSRLVHAVFDDVEESFELKIDELSQDQLVLRMADLLQLLEDARDYWTTDWQNTIVYVKTQASCETNPRYAAIKNYSIPQLNNPFDQPFLQPDQKAVFNNIDLNIVRDQWQADIPGQGTCVQISSQQDWPYERLWEVAGSAPPTINPYSIIQLSNTDFLAGSGFGRISRSQDNGDTWSEATPAAFTAAVIPAALLQAANGTVYAGDNGQIVSSNDNGATWAVNDTQPADNVVSLYQLANGTILAGSRTAGSLPEIWQSQDNGSSWSSLVTFSDATTANGLVEAITQRANGEIIIGIGTLGTNANGAAIYVSDDNGSTWRIAFFNSQSSIFDVKELSDGYAYFTISNTLTPQAQIWVSKGDSFSWRLLHNFTTLGSDTDALFLFEASDTIMYALTDTNIYSSNDRGITWVAEQTVSHPSQPIQGDIIQAADGSIYSIGVTDQILRLVGGDILSLGQEATCDNDAYISNSQNISNLTHIKIDDGGAGSFTDVFPAASFPQNLLPAVPAQNDVVYFGVQASILNSGPFDNLVFDIVETNSTGFLTAQWQYWSGAAWTTLTAGTDYVDNAAYWAVGATDIVPFMRDGVNSWHWQPPSDWAATTVDSISALWVRMEIQKASGSAFPVQQQNRDVYIANTPRVEIASTQVMGDIPAIARIKATNWSDADGRSGGGLDLFSNRVIVGLRSRGAFQAYLNASDEQNPIGVSVVLGPNTSYSDDVTTPTGRRATYNPAGVEAMATRVRFDFGINAVTNYYGTFHAFVRARRTAGSTTDLDIRLQVVTSSGGVISTTQSKQLQTTTAWELLDFGQVKLPAAGEIGTNIGDTSQVRVQASAASGTPDLYIYDLILIPVDEWAIDTTDFTNSNDSALGRENDIIRLLDIDSLTDPKNPILSLIREKATDEVTSIWLPVANGKAILQPNASQSYWFLSARTDATGASPNWISEPWLGLSIGVTKSQRYLGMRGAE